jgi:GntR family phosphonate transport system transcriptional regulator
MTTARSRPPSGYSAWRLIADELRREIVSGARPPGGKLPPEGELAERFGVHRNTVRQAVAALAAEHLVVARRGSGTFVSEHTVLVHRIGARTRLSNSLGRRGRAAGRLLESAIELPPAEIAERLLLGDGAVLRLEIVLSVDGLPLSRATHWFVADLVPGLAEHFAATGSITGTPRRPRRPTSSCQPARLFCSPAPSTPSPTARRCRSAPPASSPTASSSTSGTRISNGTLRNSKSSPYRPARSL